MIKILHFADAHIDIANFGRHDPETGLPYRVLDFLKALDTIVDTAITEAVDLVIFAGDAYKDRSPQPTFQREWGKRIMRLSQAGIPTILLVGNHDLSPAIGRAHALQEYDTLHIAHTHVVAKPTLLLPADLDGLPVQVIALPWVTRSNLMATLEMSAAETGSIHEEIEVRLKNMLDEWLTVVDPELPLVLTAHATVQGATYGGERSVMLGNDLVLPGSLVRDSRLDYVALGHIHKAQSLNSEMHPPVIYPGSIERVDFGEAEDEKYFVIASVERGSTRVDWRKLNGRVFIDRVVDLSNKHNPDQPLDSQALLQDMITALPDQEIFEDAKVRLKVYYPREWEPLIDEQAIRKYAEGAFDFQLDRKPIVETRLRLPGDQSINSLPPEKLLELYWKSNSEDIEEIGILSDLAREIIQTALLHEADDGERTNG